MQAASVATSKNVAHGYMYLPTNCSAMEAPVGRCTQQIQMWFDFSTYIRVSLVGEPAIDEGAPLREFLHLLMGSIATNNALFSGSEECRMLAANLAELGKNTYKHVGEMIAVSLIHGGPAPAFFVPAVADYILHGIKVPDLEVRDKLKKVSNHMIIDQALHCILD